MRQSGQLTGSMQALRMSKIVGIDLGTTHSAIAVVEAGMPDFLPTLGRRLLPSVVHYPENGEPVVA